MSILEPIAEWSRPPRDIGRRVLYYDELPSAMTTAAAVGEPGVAVIAGEQTAGRGQYGRSWACPRGSGVLLAVVVAPPAAARRPAVLTAWAAVGVAECIQSLTSLQPRIKWPNDVLIDGKKVCGILIESAAGKAMTAVAGIGLNVTQSAADFAAAGLPDATSLAASTGRTWKTASVAERLLDELDRTYRLLDGGLTTLEARWANRLGLVGLHVTGELTDRTRLTGGLRSLSFDAVELDGDGTVTRLAPEAVRHLAASP
jgi:BirA family biotin operon repressor/biotin-[acetyl-CoA-carboxylase] ligase